MLADRFNGGLARRFEVGSLIYGGELMYFKMTRAAVTVAGGVVALCLGSVPAALAAPAQNTSSVPCNPQALNAAIGTAHQGETLDLAPGCTYRLAGAVPHIKTNLTIVGHHSTLTRTRNAPGFSLLTVRGADLTVINVNFADGGGYKVGKGGAIDNARGTLTVTGGTFSGNETDNVGGAIYNDGHLTVKNATFTHNLAPYGGAIENDHNASITGSTFTRNKPSLHGDPRNSLFDAFARVVKWIQPAAVLVENTSYLRSQYAGQYEDSIRNALVALGYVVDVSTLNSADYGTPQIRRRAFFFGTRHGSHSL